MKGVDDNTPRPAADGADIPDEERADSLGYSEDSWDAYIDNWADLFAGAENELPKVQAIGYTHGSVSRTLLYCTVCGVYIIS